MVYFSTLNIETDTYVFGQRLYAYLQKSDSGQDAPRNIPPADEPCTGGRSPVVLNVDTVFRPWPPRIGRYFSSGVAPARREKATSDGVVAIPNTHLRPGYNTMVEGHPPRMRASGGSVGTRATGFVLPRANGGGTIVYEPRAHTEEGCVFFWFFPATRLESTHFLDWYACVDDVDVFALSNLNSMNRHLASGPGERFAPVLEDPSGHVAFAYGTTYGEPGGLSSSSTRTTPSGTAGRTTWIRPLSSRQSADTAQYSN